MKLDAAFFRSGDGGAIVILANRHCRRGGADDHWHRSAGEAGLSHCLARSDPCQPRAAVHSQGKPVIRQVDLAGRADALARDIEQGDRGKRRAALAESGGVFLKIHAHR